MKFLTACLLTLISVEAFCAVVKSQDAENNCTLYQAAREDEQGHVVLAPGQTMHSTKRVYGLSFIDMDVDFDRQEVKVQATMNVVLGLNRPLIAAKVGIRKDNPEFKFLINQLNRKVNLFEKVCLSSQNEVIYARYFPESE